MPTSSGHAKMPRKKPASPALTRSPRLCCFARSRSEKRCRGGRSTARGLDCRFSDCPTSFLLHHRNRRVSNGGAEAAKREPCRNATGKRTLSDRSEEHTSELQSR